MSTAPDLGRCTHCDKPAIHTYQLSDGDLVPLCSHHYAPIRAAQRAAEQRAKGAAA